MRPAKHMLAAALSLLLTLPVSAAGNLYRFKDGSGNPTISQSLPAEALQRGYQILNSSGRVLETVAPALTEAQIAAKKAREQELARQAEQAEKQKVIDRQLLRTYSHPDDVIKALKRKLGQMRSLISLKQGNIVSLKAQVRQEQSRAANVERSGREIPSAILTRINSLQAEITETKAEIARQKKDIDSLVAEYETKTSRLEKLTEASRTLTISISED